MRKILMLKLIIIFDIFKFKIYFMILAIITKNILVIEL